LPFQSIEMGCCNSKQRRQHTEPPATASPAEKAARQAKVDQATRAYGLNPKEVEELKREFKLFDLNDNGRVSTKELGTILAKLGHETTKAELEQLIKQEDKDGSGFMEFDEFINMVKRQRVTTNKGRASVVGKPKKCCLLIIDVQNDFCPPNGSLAVKDGDQAIPVINELRDAAKWDLIALTKDWHPTSHISFYSTHSQDKKATLFQPYELNNGNLQVLWPDHCVQNSPGSDFHPKLALDSKDLIVYKGKDINVDSYSGFMDNDKRTKSELGPKLREAGITDVFVVGLAYDYCVGSSALDSVDLGFRTYVVKDATRGVAEESTTQMVGLLKLKPVRIINSHDVPGIVAAPAPVVN